VLGVGAVGFGAGFGGWFGVGCVGHFVPFCYWSSTEEGAAHPRGEGS
jgi:hypothetical protein